MKELVEHPIIRVDREGTIRELKEIIEGLESGYVAAFQAFLDVNGIGRILKTTTEEAHPMAKRFMVDEPEPTPPTAPGRKVPK